METAVIKVLHGFLVEIKTKNSYILALYNPASLFAKTKLLKADNLNHAWSREQVVKAYDCHVREQQNLARGIDKPDIRTELEEGDDVIQTDLGKRGKIIGFLHNGRAPVLALEPNGEYFHCYPSDTVKRVIKCKSKGLTGVNDTLVGSYMREHIFP